MPSDSSSAPARCIVSVIIVNYNAGKHIVPNLRSLFDYSAASGVEIIVVDNSQPSEDLEAIKMLHTPIQIIRSPENDGFGCGMNQGFAKARGEYLLAVNPDIRFTADVLGSLVAYFRNNLDVDMATVRIEEEDGSINCPFWKRYAPWRFAMSTLTGFQFKWRSGYLAFDPERPKEVEVITGAFMFLRRSVLDRVGGFDERIFLYAEDTEFCIRAKNAGCRIFYLPFRGVIHAGHGSSGSKTNIFVNSYLSQCYVFEKHYGPLRASILKMISFYGMRYRGLMFKSLGWLLKRESLKETGHCYSEAFYSIQQSSAVRR